MPQLYDLRIDDSASGDPKKKGGLGCAVIGWSAFAVLLAFSLLVGYRTWFIYRQIQSGVVVELPRYADRLTSAAGSRSVAGTVDRAMIESESAPSFGPDASMAELVIVQFADFECPYSKEESGVVRRLMQKYGGRVRFEYRDYPLEEIHTAATQASVAARCAQEQGKFWPYHDKLYAASPAIGYADLLAMAVETGMDERQFERCLNDGRYRNDVAADRALAQQLGVVGTPTFFLNGRRIDGAIPEAAFDGLIAKMLE